MTVAKALLFPQSVETLGAAGNNLSSEVWWSASHPFKSSITGQSSAELAADYTAKTGRPWTQPIGFVHSLFEVAANVMGRVSDPTNADGVVAAIAGDGHDDRRRQDRLDGAGVPPFAAKNVTKTPLVGGQWRQKAGGFDPRHRRQHQRARDPGRRQDGTARLTRRGAAVAAGPFGSRRGSRR